MVSWKCQVCGSTKKANYVDVCQNCYVRNRYKNNPEYRERRRAHTKKVYDKNPKKKNKADKLWRSENRDKLLWSIAFCNFKHMRPEDRVKFICACEAFESENKGKIYVKF